MRVMFWAVMAAASLAVGCGDAVLNPAAPSAGPVVRPAVPLTAPHTGSAVSILDLTPGGPAPNGSGVSILDLWNPPGPVPPPQ